MKTLLLLLVLAMPYHIFSMHSQKNKESFKLIDSQSDEPISGATFTYGTQKGISDETGKITFTFQTATSMYLSHIAYGQWELDEQAISSALKDGFYKKGQSILQTLPVTIIALRPDTEQKKSLSIDYLDKTAHDAGALLNQMPAFNSIRKSGSYGFEPVFRGFKYDQLNVVIDGCQVASAACPNRMDPPISQVSPNMMNDVDIYKGPHSFRFGNAIGATINFKTHAPSFSNSIKGFGRATSAYESNGNILRTEAMGGARGKLWEVSIFGAYAGGDDYEDGDGNVIPSSFLRNSFGTNVGVKLATNQTLKLSATRNKAEDVDFPALPMDLRSDETWLLNASHEITFSDRKLGSWKTALYKTSVDHLMDNLGKNLNPRMVNASTAATTENYGGRTEGYWQFGTSGLYAGADFRMEKAEGIRERNFLMGPNAGRTLQDNAWQNSSIQRTSVFAEYHFGKNDTQFTISGRLEHNKAFAEDTQAKFDGANGTTEKAQINPSLSIGAVHDLGKGFSAGIWVARAQRSGSITERYINFFPVGIDPFDLVGNPSLEAEVNNQLDLSFGYQNQTTNIKFDVFAAYMQDFISSVIDTALRPTMPTSPGVRRFVNIDGAFKTGFEFSWSQKLVGPLRHQFSVAYTLAQDLERDEPLPEIAPMDIRYSLFASLAEGKIVPEISYRYVIEQNRVSKEFGETQTPAFDLLDAKIKCQFTKAIRATAGVQNLLDNAYYEHLNRSVRNTPNAIFAPGRNFFVSVTVDLR